MNKTEYIKKIIYDIEIPNKIGMDTIFYNRKHIKQDIYKEFYNI